MERKGDGDVWDRVASDAILFDIGVERIEAAPSAFWPELATLEMDEPTGTYREKLYSRFLKENSDVEVDPSVFQLPYEEEPKEYIKYREKYRHFRDSYKKEAGAPIRSVYVMPENFFPRYEGSTCVWAFEREQRTLLEVLRNKLFDADALQDLAFYANQLSSDKKLKQKVTIIHYSNLRIHAYYALIPDRPTGTDTEEVTIWPSGMEATAANIGKPVLLHWYPHNLGETIYNVVGGRFGGWKESSHTIEGVMGAITELTQMADELASQFATNIHNTYWSTMLEELDPDLRNAADNASPVSVTQGKIQPGQSIPLWKGENIRPMITSTPNPAAQWFYQMITQQVEKLSGSSAIYGQQDPGVRTGYHAYLQISQSEHLDEKLESRLAEGGINRALKILRHVRAMGETIWVFHRTKTANGQTIGRHLAIRPKDLKILPELDATVRKPRPVDYNESLRAAQMASQDRNGPGTPLLDDDTIRERLLGEDYPDLVERRITIQNERRKLFDSGVISQLIGKRVGTILAERSKPQISGERAGEADAALVNTIAGMEGEAEGGLSPESALAIQQAGGDLAVPRPVPTPPGTPAPSAVNGRGGGPTPGQPQSAQNAARAIQIAGRAQAG
jgi:hypothetical protein